MTGATGFVGAAVARRLLASGYEVAALVRPKTVPWRLANDISRIHIVYGSLESTSSYEEDLIGFRPDVVMHLAWHGTSGTSRDSPDQIRKNVLASVDLLTVSAKVGCEAFVGAGSQAEYGPSRVPLDESCPTLPATLYGAAKLATSVLLGRLAVHLGVRFAWLRVFSVYGPQDGSDTLVSYVIRELLAGRCPAVGKGDHMSDYLFVDDAAAAFVTVAEKQAAGVIDVAHGQARPLRETIEALRNAIDPSLAIAFGAIEEPPTGTFPLLARVSRLKELGWMPAVALESGLALTVAWHQGLRSR